MAAGLGAQGAGGNSRPPPARPGRRGLASLGLTLRAGLPRPGLPALHTLRTTKPIQPIRLQASVKKTFMEKCSVSLYVWEFLRWPLASVSGIHPSPFTLG